MDAARTAPIDHRGLVDSRSTFFFCFRNIFSSRLFFPPKTNWKQLCEPRLVIRARVAFIIGATSIGGRRVCLQIYAIGNARPYNIIKYDGRNGCYEAGWSTRRVRIIIQRFTFTVVFYTIFLNFFLFFYVTPWTLNPFTRSSTSPSIYLRRIRRSRTVQRRTDPFHIYYIIYNIIIIVDTSHRV